LLLHIEAGCYILPAFFPTSCKICTSCYNFWRFFFFVNDKQLTFTVTSKFVINKLRRLKFIYLTSKLVKMAAFFCNRRVL
jgi:hypothetical protein